jgi:hypothetical protein
MIKTPDVMNKAHPMMEKKRSEMKQDVEDGNF